MSRHTSKHDACGGSGLLASPPLGRRCLRDLGPTLGCHAGRAGRATLLAHSWRSFVVGVVRRDVLDLARCDLGYQHGQP